MTDRELLEDAAKAAGLYLDFDLDNGRPAIRDMKGGASWWNPLTNSGDAFEYGQLLRT